MRKLAGLTVAVMVLIAPVQAEIVKTETADCKAKQSCAYWWPKLPELKGWHSDPKVNLQMGDNGADVRIPDGKTYANAPALIYGRAISVTDYDRQFGVKSSLTGLVADDMSNFTLNGAKVDEAPALTTADGQTLKVTVFSKADNWECIAYGQEDGYYLMFVLSANSEAAYKQTLPVWQDVVSRYKK